MLRKLNAMTLINNYSNKTYGTKLRIGIALQFFTTKASPTRHKINPKPNKIWVGIFYGNSMQI